MHDGTLKSLKLATLGAAFLALTSNGNVQAQGSWVMKAPVPAALNEVSVVYLAGKVHVFGGAVLGDPGPYHIEYDPKTDKWDARAPAPFPAGSQ